MEQQNFQLFWRRLSQLFNHRLVKPPVLILRLEDLEKLAGVVLGEIGNRKFGGAVVLALSGELGSGKTAFVKTLAKKLGVLETVQSPTFVIEKIYKIKHPVFKHLVHIDAYRLENSLELEHLGFKEILKNPENLIALEWPERVAGLVPKDAIKVNFELTAEGGRTASVSS